MTYATQQDLIDRFGSQELIDVSDRATPPAGAIDANVVAKALADAAAEIDSYIGKRYKLPLAAPPERLKRVCADIARYYLYDNRTTEAVSQTYKDSVAWLRDVSIGRAVLDIGAGEEPASPAGPDVEASPRVFSRETMKGY